MMYTTAPINLKDISESKLNNFQKYIITNHYQFTTPLSYGDVLWKDNPFSPVTLRVSVTIII